MNLTGPRPRESYLPRLRQFAHRAGAAISEMNYAQRRLFCLMTSYDRCSFEADVPPGNYAEFLLRTSGALRHEPSASQRLAGKGIR